MSSDEATPVAIMIITLSIFAIAGTCAMIYMFIYFARKCCECCECCECCLVKDNEDVIIDPVYTITFDDFNNNRIQV